MNQIKDPPNTYNFGLEFNYALWTQGTDVTMVNVPWNNDYRDIVKFANRTALNTYINGLETSGTKVSNVSYIKPNQPIRLDIPFNTAYRYNYLRASNPMQPIPGSTPRDFYYFVTDVRYIAPNTTEVVVQLDVWQTFGYDIQFGQSYIERGHIGIANSKAFDNYGRDYLTIPEGLDTGNEYQVVTKRREIVMSDRDNINRPSNIMVVSSVDLDADPGTVTAPELTSASGSKVFGQISGAALYLYKDDDDFLRFLTNYQGKPWMTQGIMSITKVPAVTRYDPDFVYAPTIAYGDVGSNASKPYGIRLPSIKYDMLDNWRASSEILDYIGTRYAHLTKLLTSPYLYIELTTWTGAPITLKPEVWANPDASIVERPALLPPTQRVNFYPYKYNAIAGSGTDSINRDGPVTNPEQNTLFGSDVGGDDNGEYLDTSVSISSFPTAAIVNNGAISYMASNNSSIGYQRDSASWSQQRALRGNEITYDQSSSAIDTSRRLAGIGINADQQQTQIGQNASVAQGAIGIGTGLAGSMRGGGAGMAGAALNAAGSAGSLAVQYAANNQSLAVRTGAAAAGNRETTGQSSFVRDTNKSLSDWAANGDYENIIAGVNAKVQDAQLIQPNVSGQAGGETANMINESVELSVRWKMIDQASIRRIGEYWLRYGYAVQKFAMMPTELNCMSKFTYWKLKESYIVSAPMPETFKQAIRGIFEKGVTVWSQPGYIGQTDIGDNVPLGGFTL